MSSTAPLLLLAVHFSSCFTSLESKDCPGTVDFLNSDNVNGFDQCNHVRGNLIINENSISNFSSVPQIYDDLSKLSNIKEIDGYLFIERLNHSQITNMRFLRNLERIRGLQTVRLFGFQDYTLLIQNNPHLVTLNLASLKSIENGGLRISENPQLCLVDSISFEGYLVNSSLSRIGGLGHLCSGVSCHGECMEERGCWGTLPDECVMCRSYKFIRTCVDACNMSISTPNHNLRECTLSTSLPTTSTFNLNTSKGTAINLHSSTSLHDGSSSSDLPTLLVHRVYYISLIFYLVPSGVFVVIVIIATSVVALAIHGQKRKNSKKRSLSQQKHSSSMSGAPEKYSQKENDTTILVTSCGEGESKSTRRSTNVSISSLASASIHTDDRKDDLAQRIRVDGDRSSCIPLSDTSPLHNNLPLAATRTITRRNSPIEHAQNTSSCASYYTPSGGDTGYSSSATSRKPSLVGSRASSTSLRPPLSVGVATGGNVYSTGQHQLHPHRQPYNQHGGLNQQSRASLTSYQTNTSIGSIVVGKAVHNDQVNISALASNSGVFEPR